MYREEKVKGQEWEEECKVEQREVPRPKSHPLLVAMGNITVRFYKTMDVSVWHVIVRCVCVCVYVCAGREVCPGSGAGNKAQVSLSMQRRGVCCGQQVLFFLPVSWRKLY